MASQETRFRQPDELRRSPEQPRSAERDKPVACAARHPPHPHAERGSVVVVVLVLFVCFGGLVAASLSAVVSEDKKTTMRLHAMQAQVQANSRLELAKNIVNAANYDSSLQNLVLANALTRADRTIPGTQVQVERIGTTPYFRLTATAAHLGVLRTAEAVVRQSSPVSAYNLLVLDHPVGISGKPRGAIHSNRYVDFYFPGSEFRDRVSAADGFNYVAGATPENTRLAGGGNPDAPTYDALAAVDFASIATRADRLAVTEPLVAEVVCQGSEIEVKLFQPAHTQTESYTYVGTRQTGTTTESYTVDEPVYEDVTYTVEVPVYTTETYTVVESQPVWATRTVTRIYAVPVYEDREVSYTEQVPVYGTRTAQREETRRVWVSVSGGTAEGSGGTVGGGGSTTGYWTYQTVLVDYEETYVVRHDSVTRTRTERVQVGTRSESRDELEYYVSGYQDVSVTRTRQVQTGTTTQTRTRRDQVGWTTVTRTREVPVYESYTETRTREVQVDETLVRTERVPADGTIYLAGDIRKLQGQLNGRVSLVSGGRVQITDSLVYIDDDGRSRMLNGLDPTQPYVSNPAYQGDSLLAVMARGDLVYDNQGPEKLEINASLISVEGSVGFEGIDVSADGSDVGTSLDTSNAAFVRDSLRRLGGIVSRKRPVATFIDEFGNLAAGFERGESIMDQNLILSSGSNAPPPFMFEGPQPTWIITTCGQRLGVIQ